MEIQVYDFSTAIACTSGNLKIALDEGRRVILRNGLKIFLSDAAGNSRYRGVTVSELWGILPKFLFLPI